MRVYIVPNKHTTTIILEELLTDTYISKHLFMSTVYA